MGAVPAAVTAFAPASIGNVAVGFDMLGLAIEGIGDRVTATRVDADGVRLSAVVGPDGDAHGGLAPDAASNTAGVAARALWRDHGRGGGVELVVQKGVPLESGMGSSAASAVAAVVAVNALLAAPLPVPELLPYALEGERLASGELHADNVAPSLLGGLVLCPPALLPRAVPLPLPSGVSSVLLHPDLEINTAASRRRLAGDVPRERWLEQQGYLAAFVAACATDDHALLRQSLKDVVIEPQRAASVPCFAAVRDAALAHDAYGCSLSGSGPSMFALAADGHAAALAAAMQDACRGAGYACRAWISPMASAGAELAGGA